MTAADVASINLHSDIYSVLQLMSSHDESTAEDLEVSIYHASQSTDGLILRHTLPRADI